MEITEEQLFDATVTIVAGIMANPALAFLLRDPYSQQREMTNVTEALRQHIHQAGGQIVNSVNYRTEEADHPG